MDPAFALPPAGSLGSAGGPVSNLPVPPAFPQDIPLAQQGYVNWAKDIRFDAVWTATARTPDDVVRIANWARDNGYRVRAKGTMHGWSPLTVVPGENVEKTLLVDTMTHLNGVSVNPNGTPATVTAGGGASLEAILTRCRDTAWGGRTRRRSAISRSPVSSRSARTAPPIRRPGRRSRQASRSGRCRTSSPR